MFEHFNVTITPFNRERTVRVYLPKGYENETSKRYPVLYMHDGQNLYKDEDASYGMSWGISDFLDESGMELIVVGIDCAHGTQRLDEYAPWVSKELGEIFTEEKREIGGEGKEYIDYMVHELKPMIDRTYRTIPEETSMAGSSMGGLISTYAACVYPSIFKRVAAVSSAYWVNQKEIEELIRLSDLSAVERFYLDIGTAESTESADNQKNIDSSEKVYKLLKDKIELSRLRFDVVEGAVHNELAWKKRVPEIFAFLYQ
jgi:predicted alpha/beta superfamily hydrolase